ncbi:hypothetical protein BGZ76_009292 [Entomortierella beljakovae]|nr:hypothetical protein BGZ76_009292 [Entomortierella beljakovae]
MAANTTSKDFQSIENSKITLDPRDANTPDKWIERHPELVRLTGKHPFNCEAPLPLLVSNGFITPTSLHYVRNHGSVPQLSWESHRITIDGLVNGSVTLTMDMLEQLPSVTLPVTLVCAGNRRKEQNMHKQSIGFSWGPGGVSTSVWKGVLVRDLLLNICGGIQKGAKYVCFDGCEKLPNGKYGTSLTIERTLNSMSDVLIAYEQNGARLSPDHGYPVRLIVPGIIGGRSIKYLSRITVTDCESDSWYHYHDNRVLPSVVTDADMAKREQWWQRPDYIINELNINSAISSPAHGSALSISDPLNMNKEITISGYAYNGGCKKVTRVEVTLDAGKSWLLSDLEHPEEWPEFQFCNDPYPRQRYWCWCFWSVKIPVRELLNCKDIQVRAWDSTLNTQPKDLNWNLMGMMNNCWYRVQVDLAVAEENGGELVLRFTHPTVPGPESGGGWMRAKGDEAAKENAVFATKPVPIMTTALSKPKILELKAEDAKPDTVVSKADEVKVNLTPGVNYYTADMVSKHDADDDCWIIHSDKVYDCTEFLKEHPGGVDSITMNGGQDCTEDFDAIHSSKAREMLAKYYIGDLVESLPEVVESAPKMKKVDSAMSISTGPLTPLSSDLFPPDIVHPPFLDPKKWQDVTLVKKVSLTHNTRLFRFALGHPLQTLGLPLGKHIFLKVKSNNTPAVRAYTPTSIPQQQGYVDLVVKVYFKDTDPRFPAGGVVSQHLNSMEIGEKIAIKGPTGSFTYDGLGQYTHASGRSGKCLQVGMICGGTGLTPMYQLLQAVSLDKANDPTKLSLIFGNRTEDDILMRKEVDDVGKELGRDRFRLWHVLSEETPEQWKYGTGYISKEIIKDHLFPSQWDSSPADDLSNKIVLLCGPPPMINLCCIPALTELYGKEFVDNNVFCF